MVKTKLRLSSRKSNPFTTVVILSPFKVIYKVRPNHKIESFSQFSKGSFDLYHLHLQLNHLQRSNYCEYHVIKIKDYMVLEANEFIIEDLGRFPFLY